MKKAILALMFVLPMIASANEHATDDHAAPAPKAEKHAKKEKHGKKAPAAAHGEADAHGEAAPKH